MKSHFELFTRENLDQYVSKRFDLNEEGVSELEDTSRIYAQEIEISDDLENLADLKANYIIIGIPEDIGVRANLGRAGASEAWSSFLNSFLGLQNTSLNAVSRFCVLGNVNTEDLMSRAAGLDSSLHDDRLELSHLVQVLDQRVSEIALKIIEAGKIPVVIGGGHNNCYPLLRACGYTRPIDCINIDAHTDLRAAKGRHSGNGFSHAIQEGHLKSYFMIGIQENYLSQPMIDLISNNYVIDYSKFNHQHVDVNAEVKMALQHIDSDYFALEVDMDAVANFPSSAQSPVGYSFQEMRSMINEIIKQSNRLPRYIHICEAAPKYGYPNQVGKALATLVNDLP
ncbi:formimidoylglutamase [Nonlabens sp. Asnod2-A12]|uniref:formimidoylglutamase n=1 Tax=Nonlabens sp. Asnod2-A12 TaxID=3160578 RepID=UPI00386B4237